MKKKIIAKNYGSIPHLSISKLAQQADKKVTRGQEDILTKKPRDYKDLIIVTEKIDGSNVGVVRQNHQCFPISRAGYHVNTSPYVMHEFFAKFMFNKLHMFDWLPEGWRVVGEWCVMAHGTIYDITAESPFVAFDIIDEKNQRLSFLRFYEKCVMYKIPMVPLVHIGQPISIKNAMKIVGKGIYGKPEKPEGVVYRVEREGKVDFLAKFVRLDKEDGKYLDSNIWNKGSGYDQAGLK